MKTHTKVVILLLVFSSCSLSGQNKYSIDQKGFGNRRLGATEFFKQLKESQTSAKVIRRKKRTNNKNANKTRKHTYKNQTKAVQKRMDEQEEKAFHFNNGTIPFNVKLKRIFSWMILVR